MAKEATIYLDQQGKIAIVRLNDPVTLNALSETMIETLQDVLDRVEASSRAMILTGTGKAFCSGANLNGGFPNRKADPAMLDCGVALETHVNPLVARLREFKIPWISAVRGVAAGGGASLALAGDMVIAADNASFIQAFARIGLVPDGGALHMLTRTVGRVRANELALLGGQLSAEEACSLGLINRVVPDDILDKAALELAGRLAEGAASLSVIRKLTWDALDQGWQDMLRAERVAQRDAGRTQDFQEGVAAFREKRPAKFSGA
ncbi:MAG: enoyl-CoA hydratase-related protein [Sphingomonadaceae bacterium]